MVRVMKRKKRRISGTAEKPRLYIFKSLKYIYAQIIDDESGKTLASLSSKKLKEGKNVKAAEKVGKEIAALAKAKGVSLVVYDRGDNLFHGGIKALADAARGAGLKF